MPTCFTVTSLQTDRMVFDTAVNDSLYSRSMSTVSDDETKHNIAANIRRLLTVRNQSQNGLANAIGESPTRINQYAQGKKMPGAGVLTRIAEEFKVSLDELISPPPAFRGRKKVS